MHPAKTYSSQQILVLCGILQLSQFVPRSAPSFMFKNIGNLFFLKSKGSIMVVSPLKLLVKEQI